MSSKEFSKTYNQLGFYSLHNTFSILFPSVGSNQMEQDKRVKNRGINKGPSQVQSASYSKVSKAWFYTKRNIQFQCRKASQLSKSEKIERNLEILQQLKHIMMPNNEFHNTENWFPYLQHQVGDYYLVFLQTYVKLESRSINLK